MTYNFDEEIGRFGTSSVKWEFIVQGEEIIHGDHAHPKHGSERILPMWVADMDFKAPPAVGEALIERAKHGIFGYTRATDSYYDAFLSWARRRYKWEINPEWITITPGVVTALNLLVQTFVEPGQKVIIQRPVYYPFTSSVENNGGVIVSNSLRFEEGRYGMDFDDLAQKAADPDVKMLILSNPHNPVSRLWNVDELTRLGEICLANDVLVIADEIHCDLIFSGSTFVPFASISEAFAQNSVTCMAPSKTFNLAGLKTSNIIIPNPAIKARLDQALINCGLWGNNAFGVTAAEAAYRHGEDWLEAMMAYVEENYRFMVDYLARHLPQLRPIQPEGTYLAWVDCRALELTPEERKHLIMDRARVYLDEGELFGPEGEGFERINLACPRHLLAEALDRLRRELTANSG